jgi:hypothetical protein
MMIKPGRCKLPECGAIGMSALGQKQTFAVQKGMSALPPKADIQRIGLHWFLTERLRSEGEHEL